MGPKKRSEDLISAWLKSGERVLDLGCGNGAFLKRLESERRISGYGVEVDADEVVGCIAAGVPVIQADIERGLPLFADGSFDTVMLLHTLQELGDPAGMLKAMLRVGRRAIVTFPNAGHWRRRLALLGGRVGGDEDVSAPRLQRLITTTDFERLCRRERLRIGMRTCLSASGAVVSGTGPNADLAAYLLESAGSDAMSSAAPRVNPR